MTVDIVLFRDAGQRRHASDDLGGVRRPRVIVRVQQDVAHVERPEIRDAVGQVVERDEG